MPAPESVPFPFLLNTWKHHAGWIRRRIRDAVTAGPDAVAALPAELAVVGTRLMDLYVGAYSAAEVADRIGDVLRAAGRFDRDALTAWLAPQGEYAVLALPDDSGWTVRLGPANGRYVHLHPARWAPRTVRVQANTLRSAVMAHAVAALSGSDPTDLAVVNHARGRYLGLLPVRELTAGGGLGAVIALLR